MHLFHRRALGVARVSLVFLLWIVGTAPAQAGLIEVIAAAKPSVVAVGSFNALSNPRFGFRGTGFVVRGANLVVTNAHVLPESGEATVTGSRLVIQTPRGTAGPEIRASVSRHQVRHDSP